jgi:RNA polymerase sigma-70 factor (ECF subfamily)
MLRSQEFDEDYPRLFARLTRLGRALGAGDDAEDIAQDVLVEARHHLRELRDSSKLEAWLRRLMVRSCGRHRGRRRPVGIDATVAYVPADRSAVLDLGAAVARLPARERLAVTLVYGLGLSEAEAADAMAIARGGLASALFKARARLA